MSYNFLYGSSGSGKTTRAFRDIIQASLNDPDGRFFVLVPEQYSMMMQKRLLDMHPDHATENIDVLSFNRLAYRVFDELSIKNPVMMDDAGKSMILRRVAEEQGKNLSVWKDRFKKPGFVSTMTSMISELTQYGIRPEDIRTVLKSSLKPMLRNKLSDMLVIYESFSDFIKDRFITTEELLDVFCRNLPESRLIRDAVILMDGFTGFTPVQYRLIEIFLEQAKSVSFTAAIGDEANLYRHGTKEDLFYMSTDMAARITDLASRNRVSHGEDIALKQEISPRFRNARDLQFLEKHFLRYDRAAFSGEENNIRIGKSQNPREESVKAAGEILRLVQKEGYRYRDIAVVVGDLAGYGEEIKHEFRLQNIPYYVDENLDVSQNPLPEFLRSAMGVMTEQYSYDSVMRFLKSGLVEADPLERCIAENYMLECGIRGYKKLSEPWTYVPKDMTGTDMEKLNSFKDSFLAVLEPLHEAVRDRKASVKTLTEALSGLLLCPDVQKKMMLLCETFKEENNPGRIREYERILPEIRRLFSEMEELLGEEQVKREEYAGILDSGLNEIRVGMIPACADRVLIGDLKRSRLSEIRALFLLGANDGLIPKTGMGTGVLTDREKETLKTAGLELSPTVKEDLYTQRYYLYRMLTQPGEKLFISFSGMDRQGKALRMSALVNGICKSFPKLMIHDDAAGIVPEILSEKQAERVLIRDLQSAADAGKIPEGPEGEKFHALYSEFSAPEERKLKRDILTGAAVFQYADTGLGSKTAEKLYGEELTGSVTRLENYAGCPCVQFLKYGLGLKERKIYEIGAQDIGMLSHASIEIVFKRAAKEKIPLIDMEDDKRDDFVAECVKEALLNDESGLFRDSARSGYLGKRLTGITQRSIWVFVQQLKHGDFKTSAFEEAFETYGKMRGKIDRVDLAEDQGRLLVKIVDYKTGADKWEPYRILSGTQIQLILYLDAVTEMLQKKYPGKEIIPAAMFYNHVDNPVIDRDKLSAPQEQEEIDRKTILAMRPSGLVNSDREILRHLDPDPDTISSVAPVKWKQDNTPDAASCMADTEGFQQILRYVRDEVQKMKEEIREGKVSVSPLSQNADSSACTYCPYGAVCGFDTKAGGYEYRQEKQLPADEVWRIIKEETQKKTEAENSGQG